MADPPADERAPIDEPRLRAGLGPRWRALRVVGTTRSTNGDLAASPGAADGTVLVAEHQDAGRGRLDRTWVSPPRAGLLFSLLVRPGVPVPTWGWLPLLAGVALHDAVGAATGVAVGVKWPNDLLHAPSGDKLAGILAQTAGDAVVIGIGLNVSTTAAELPVGTSLALHGAATLDRTLLLVDILRELDRRLTGWLAAGGDAAASGLAGDYLDVCATIGRRVSVSTVAGPTVEARAVGIDDEGRLLLEGPAGTVAIGAGDVRHLRPVR